MGYYTVFNLEWETNDWLHIIDFLEKNQLDYDAFYSDGKTTGATRWYNYHDQMTKLSLQFPNTLFILSGEGEDCSDLWKEYFKNGKSKRIDVQIVWPPIDLSSFD